ncbi:MAG: hypothetical protein H7242_15325 [Microbacteriaceae bacterium]|nr:hypothetical protein [Burkholderiaceae bacterium]
MRGHHRPPSGAGFVDGWVTVVGRSQGLSISDGENIDPAEPENLAATWPGVAEAAVVGLPDARWGEVPVLVPLAQAGAVVDLNRLRWRIQLQPARVRHPRAIVLENAAPYRLGQSATGAVAAPVAATFAAPVAATFAAPVAAATGLA